MNQSQREFLISKIERQVKDRKEELEKLVPHEPSLVDALYKAANRGELLMRNSKAIKADLRDREGGWLDSEYSYRRTSTKADVHMKIHPDIFFLLPPEFNRAYAVWEKKKAVADEVIKAINEETDLLITRIRLSSPKTLDAMVAEVDDMGDIKLMDLKLKEIGTMLPPALEGGDTPKQLS